MGKVAATPTSTEPTKKRKKKGRPSLLDLQKRALEQQQRELELQQHQEREKAAVNSNTPNRRSRRNPNSDEIPTSLEFVDDDDDDERKEKKVKLVVRLPQSNQHFPRSSSANSGSFGSDSNDNPEEASALKKPKISGGSGDQEEKVSKVTDTLHGSPLESGPTTPLPDKKLLVFILDRLQKKDTYGVFSEPVDPNELPDYHEIIENPMDFGTLRNKLDDGLYTNLEELEADVFLICSNAMQYNSSDTIYFRQAKSIQELAKRDFENLRQEGDNGELQPKVVRRGRPPGSKQSKKPLGRPPLDRVASEFTSGATLASEGDNNTPESNPYNLRRAPAMYRFNSGDGLLSSQRSRENYSEWLADWNDEFPASILRADMKYGKKNFFIDETRRDTYRQFHPSSYTQDPSPLSGLGGDMKQLMAVGLNVEHGYARSLARFAANLGPVVWKVASKKIERVLPMGMKFGPGWVGENESLLQRSLHRLPSEGPDIPSTSEANPVMSNRSSSSLPPKEELDEPHSQLHVPRTGVSGLRPVFQGPQHSKAQLHPIRNGFNGAYNQTVLVGGAPFAGKTVLKEGEEANRLAQSSRTLHSENILESDGMSEPGKLSGKESWQQVSSTNQHQRLYTVPVPPDLNVGLQGSGSPGSGQMISSPHKPDLALQL